MLIDSKHTFIVSLPKRVSNWEDLGGDDILTPQHPYTDRFDAVVFDFTDNEACAPTTFYEMIERCDRKRIKDISFINIPYRHTEYLMKLSIVFDIPVTVKVRPK